MIPTKTRQEIEIPSIFTADGRKPNACVLLENECFGIPGGSYLLIDTNTPYENGKISVINFSGKAQRLVRVFIAKDETLIFVNEDDKSISLNKEVLNEAKGMRFEGVVLQVVIDVNAEFSSERFHASLHPEAPVCGEV